MIYKFFLYAVLLFAYAYGCGYIFNHINSWAGILLAIVGVAFLATQANKKFKPFQ